MEFHCITGKLMAGETGSLALVGVEKVNGAIFVADDIEVRRDSFMNEETHINGTITVPFNQGHPIVIFEEKMIKILQGLLTAHLGEQEHIGIHFEKVVPEFQETGEAFVRVDRGGVFLPLCFAEALEVRWKGAIEEEKQIFRIQKNTP
jgi:hypothetical protein